MRNESKDLYSRFTARKVTPNQASRMLYKDNQLTNEAGESFEDVWQALPEDLMSKFTTDTGGLNQQKIQKFMEELELLMVRYKLVDLIKMSPECIRVNGSINTNKLEAILNGKYDD